MSELTGTVGFVSCITEKRFYRRRRTAIELIATLALVVSLIVAATAVSIGMARAQALGAVGDSDGAPLAIAVFFGALIAGMGGLTAIAAREPRIRRH